MKKKILLSFLLVGLFVGLHAKNDSGKGRHYSRTEAKSGASSSTKTIDKVRDQLNAMKKGDNFSLATLLGDAFKKLPIPDVALKLFDSKITLDSDIGDKLPFKVKGASKGLSISGSFSFNNFRFAISLYLTNTSMPIVVIGTPKAYKVSDLFPVLKVLDNFKLPKLQYTISSVEFTNSQGITKLPGFYVDAEADLSGPLGMFKQLQDAAKVFDFVAVDNAPIRFHGQIPVMLTRKGPKSWIRFTLVLPFRFGIDFTKLRPVPRSMSNVIKKYTTDDIEIIITIPMDSPQSMKLSGEIGTRLTLGTQKNPIRLSSIFEVIPVDMLLSAGARIRNMVDFKWFALGNFGLQLDWDFSLLSKVWAAGVPVPCSGFGYRGQLDVGAGKNRASFKVAAQANIKDQSLPGLVSHLEAKNINFSHLIELLAMMAKRVGKFKKPFPKSAIPMIKINEIKGYFVPFNTTIAKEFYKAGLGFKFDINMFNQKVLYDINIDHEQLRLDGVATLSNIIIKPRGRTLFALTGPGVDQKRGTKDDGPIVFCDFDALNPLAAMFGVRGKLEIPPLGLSNDVNAVFNDGAYTAKLEAKVGEFEYLYDLNLSPLDIKKTYLKISFKNDIVQALIRQMKKVLNQQKNNAQKVLNKLADVGKDVSKKVTDTAKEIAGKAGDRADDIKKDIAKIEKEIDSLKKKREKGRNIIEKAAITAQIAAKKAALAARKVALGAVIGAEKTIKAGSGAVEKVTKEIEKAKVLRRSIDKVVGEISKTLNALANKKIIQIKKASGSYSVREMFEGKLPRIDIVVRVNFPGKKAKTISIRNLQFDVKKAPAIFAKVAKVIIKEMGLVVKVS